MITIAEKNATMLTQLRKVIASNIAQAEVLEWAHARIMTLEALVEAQKIRIKEFRDA